MDFSGATFSFDTTINGKKVKNHNNIGDGAFIFGISGDNNSNNGQQLLKINSREIYNDFSYVSKPIK